MAEPDDTPKEILRIQGQYFDVHEKDFLSPGFIKIYFKNIIIFTFTFSERSQKPQN
ncbi:hypothetical protein [Pantoea alhagi]|uniref:hypothetical protein n=1 Tax=Pantoea alhagi TaxID=1891675 RepID=UPI0012F4993C|nr:hypothetical protein [Pantoea alhagi]